MSAALKMSEQEFHDWLKTPDRRGLTRSIGGSQIGALLGMNKFKTATDVWDDFFEVHPVDEETKKHLDRGIRMEPIICDIYAQKYPTRKLYPRAAKYYVTQQGAVLHSLVDRIVVDEENLFGAEGVLEAKCPDTWIWEQTLENGIDPSYYAQIQQYMLIENAPWGSFAIFNVGEWRLHDFPVFTDAKLQTRLLAAADWFWSQHIMTRVRPSSVLPFTTPEIPHRLGAEAVEWVEPRLVRLLTALRAAHEEKQIATKLFDGLKEQVTQEMVASNTERVQGGGVKVSWLESTHSSLDKELMIQDGIDVERYTRRTASRTFRTTVMKERR